jgi:CheY-like chemotaxis protein/Tfp pilus assembly protein PilZ
MAATESTRQLSERMVLRAELVHQARQIIAHTTELTQASVFVRTDEPLALGTSVALRLSFPRLLAPLDLEAQVVSIDPGLGHGYSAGVKLEFHANPEERERLAWLLGDVSTEVPRADVSRILVVEDSALMRDFIQLGADRFTRGSVRVVVDTADTAEAALEVMRGHTYDLVLVDMYLPGAMDGAQLVRTLRTTETDLPVIGFSVGGVVARDAFLSAGADLFLDKPVMMRDVFTTLERLVVKQARTA